MRLHEIHHMILLQESTPNPRISLGFELLSRVLSDQQITVSLETIPKWDSGLCLPRSVCPVSSETYAVYAGIRGESRLLEAWETQGLLLYHSHVPEGEGYYLTSLPGQRIVVVTGGSATGTLYGLLRLTELIRQNEADRLEDLAEEDAPVFTLRGPAIGLQLTHIEPPRLTYEYPITPERFPWFYDRSLWLDFLDLLLWNRCNVLYLWTGQPFSSLVDLPDYPEALEVTAEEYEHNREIFRWLTMECDRRGIWLVLKFYSIHIPLPLAQSRGVELLQSQITPLNTDYTRKAIIAFIRSFPHIGLMVCLGEALRGTQNKTDWFLNVILPAVKEGAKQAELPEEPPLILRGHDCDPNAIMDIAIHRYRHLFTMWKYNGESLTTWLPAGKWQQTHEQMAAHGQTHIMNVHVLANLEPFRYAAPRFIQRCVQAGHRRLGAGGLHLYPLFFWDWPWAPDRRLPRLLQPDRDIFWYRMWFRYAWQPDRDPETEELYWTKELADYYGCGRDRSHLILSALNAAGECAPRILRRIGITEGNRQTLSLGMTMSQLTNVRRYRPNEELWHSASTPGETPEEYVQRELAGKEHFGETPVQMAEEVAFFAERAWSAVCQAAFAPTTDSSYEPPDEALCCQTPPAVTAIVADIRTHREELIHMVTDILAILEMSRFYAAKLSAALSILTYRFSMDEHLRGDLSLLEAACVPWEESLSAYRRLTSLTERTYLYANSMQTRQRKIPFPDGDAYGHWTACLPLYEQEYSCFLTHLQALREGQVPFFPGNCADDMAAFPPLPRAAFTLLSENCETFPLRRGEALFTDMPSAIATLAPELSALTGVRFRLGEAIEQGVTIRLNLPEDAQLLVGYMDARGVEWLQVPDLETNTHADARGGLAVALSHAAQAQGCPDVNVHVFQYEKGTHEIYLGTGGFVLLGAVPAGIPIHARDAGLSGETPDRLDWMYEP